MNIKDNIFNININITSGAIAIFAVIFAVYNLGN